MMKYLLLGASALALTATVASAQVVPQGTLNTPTELTITKTTSAPVTSAEQSGFRTAQDNKDRSASMNAVDTGASVIDSKTALPSLLLPGNKSSVEQDGNNNVANVDQQGGNRGWAAVKQDGNYNTADIDQDDNRPALSQLTQNAAYIQQVGGSNGDRQSAEINQNRDDPSAGNPINTATILQGGFGNVAGGDNRARVDQSGTANDVMIAQGVGANSTDQDNYAYVEQLRVGGGQNNRNRAGIQQREDSKAQIFQRNAAASTAFIVQDNSGLLGVESNIVQTGWNNHASTFQDVELGGAESFIRQMGNSNQAYVNQSGNLIGGTSELFQTGDSNIALVQQTVAPLAASYVSQTGNSNTATVRQ